MNGVSTGSAALFRVVHTARLASLARQAGSFTAIGVASSLASAALYLLLREWLNAGTAMVLAVTITTLGSTEANRRMTFDSAASSRTSLAVHNLSVIAFYCTYNSIALWVVHQLVESPSARVESAGLLLASILGGVLRFALLRGWVFRDRTAHGAPMPGGAPRSDPPVASHAQRSRLSRTRARSRDPVAPR